MAKALRYVHKTWIGPWSKKVIKSHTKRFLHLDTTVTSRGEGAHRQLKQQLAFSTGDLFTVVDNIEVLLTNLMKENWDEKLGHAQNRTRYQLLIPFFRELTAYASVRPMEAIGTIK